MGELTLLVAQNCLCPSLISGLNFCSRAFCTLQIGGGSRPVCRASCAQTHDTQLRIKCLRNLAAAEVFNFQVILLIEVIFLNAFFLVLNNFSTILCLYSHLRISVMICLSVQIIDSVSFPFTRKQATFFLFLENKVLSDSVTVNGRNHISCKYLESSNVFHPYHKLVPFSKDALASTLALILLTFSSDGSIFLLLGKVQ